ncbi:MAG TPA: RdgB/HAM1 family non-canonical purine NTP pyrophosphatase [Oscillospiraceae bacterium]|nr:RdgB/HAM1 family non-canonical purine NTP pyrophosphatase [Oscillospiraceae bacterium]
MKKFLIASHNLKKQNELSRILEPLGITVITAEKAGFTLTDVEETGETFEENALLKARNGAKEGNMPCVADDSGLCVDYLGGAPGIYSARYAGEHGNDEKNIEKLIFELKDVPKEKRTARFMSVVACVFPSGREIVCKGECEGEIGFKAKGNGGFGYDPIFYVGGKSFGELDSESKDILSHRGKALKKLREELL